MAPRHIQLSFCFPVTTEAVSTLTWFPHTSFNTRDQSFSVPPFPRLAWCLHPPPHSVTVEEVKRYVIQDPALHGGFPGGSDIKESTCNAGDLDSIPGLGRSPRGEHGNPLQYSCLENPHGQRSLAGCSPWGRKELDMTELLSTAQIKAAYCHLAYLIYMQSTSCEMPGWMKHKLESGLLGEISITSDTQMTKPLWQKAKRN